MKTTNPPLPAHIQRQVAGIDTSKIYFISFENGSFLAASGEFVDHWTDAEHFDNEADANDAMLSFSAKEMQPFVDSFQN